MRPLIRLATFSDRISAENVKNFLESSGIQVMLSSDDAGGLRPELTLTRGVKLWVNEEDEKEAREALLEIRPVSDLPAGPEAQITVRGFLTNVRKWLRGN